MIRAHWAIALHGGAGGKPADMSAAEESDCRAGLAAALEAGASVLRSAGTALDAVEAAIRVLEDDPHFNAGRGAVFSARGRNELDAAIMDGSNLRAGSVAAVRRTRHPISLARAVMEKSEHVMLCGDGADAFSRSQRLEQVEPSYFFTEKRWRDLIDELTKQSLPIPPRPRGAPKPTLTGLSKAQAHRYGTVGAVARDAAGHVAAGTSTGGTTAKRWGRIGDSPIIGAGTYASDQSCAASATGSGEHFIRLTAAREIGALVQYRHMPLQAAVDEVVQHRLGDLGGHGGVIVVAPNGKIAWTFSTELMFRAKASESSQPVVSIYRNEP
ncbi:MAG TPA: isoaspartyl peptidase/L-asparaginase [Alphaproteobacteria bacterium]|nr:isoaspartyl peptidase/L-asparaginase [Alphaproteobacteria bacterium]